MTYYQFIHAVEEKIKKEVKEERKISVHTNIKNNGVKRTGIMISENGINHRQYIWKNIFNNSKEAIHWN